MEMTLREVCNRAGVTRHAVQGYEKAGLIMVSGKNERGHLLYDMHSLERIKQIKLYQQFGFSIKEIQILIGCAKCYTKGGIRKTNHVDEGASRNDLHG